jgi:hypothetical protein
MPSTGWERLSATGTVLTVDDNGGGNKDIRSLANNVGVLLDEIDNSAGLWTHADFECAIDFGTNPTGPVELYAITALDGTNYVDSQITSVAFGAPGTRIGAFSPRAVTTLQKCILRDVPIPASKFKILMVNKAGYAFDGTGKYLTIFCKRMKLNP